LSNNPPNAEANASPNSVNPGQQVALIGTGSSDEDGTISSFSWEQLDGRPVTLQNKDKSIATFTAPNEDTTLSFKLTVTDNQGQTDSTTLKVKVKGQDEESISKDTKGSTNSNEDTDAEED
jgi:chitinase